MKVKYSVYDNAEVETQPEVSWASYEISDGKFTISNEKKIVDIYGKLSAAVTTEIEYTKALIAMDFVKEVSIGTVKFGLEVNSVGEVILHYIVEDVLRVSNNVKYNQIYEFEIIVNDKEALSSSQTAILKSLSESLAEVSLNADTAYTTAIIFLAIVGCAVLYMGGWANVSTYLLVLGLYEIFNILKEVQQDEA